MTDVPQNTERILLALRQARASMENLERSRHEPIAIVGIGCRFPGEADNAEEYWRLLCDGVDAVGEVPRERWDNDAIYHPDRREPGKTYTRHGAFIRLPDLFDAEFFSLSPREAARLDPQQRLLLETAWEALEDAGLAAPSLAGQAGGVYIGIGQSHYGDLQLNPAQLATIDTHTGTGSLSSFASGRLSYWLGLTGPSLSVDTACSSSLVAVHLACQSLRAGETDIALAGGVHLNLAPHVSIFLSRAGVLAPDGRTKAFEAAADGFGRGEGCAVIVLKRLSDALADGDPIHALIRGSAVDHDGAGAGLTVPSETAQIKVIRDCLANAQLTPAEIGFIETHGTGTELGDPIELRALASVFAAHHRPENPLYLGAVKSSIGHLEAAAGLAGLIKAVLVVKHGRIPVQCHFHHPNPHIPWEELPFAIPRQTLPWPAGHLRRLAGISAFGMSGTNAHVVLEAAPPASAPAAENREYPDRPLHLLLLSAQSKPALQAMIKRYRNHLADHPQQNLADICHGAARGRGLFEHRLAVVCASREEAAEQLAALEQSGHASGAVLGRVPKDRLDERPVFLFTGQGSQYWRMGHELFQTQPCFRAAVDRCAAILDPLLEKPLLDILHGDEQDRALIDRTDFTQPALFTIQYGLAELWRSWGVEPSAVLGHSLGEYAAACVAGLFSLEDGLRLVAERGRLMHRLPGNGAMAAVFCDDAKELERWLKSRGEEVVVSAYNSPRELVLSGPRSALITILDHLSKQGVTGRELTVSHAFHSPLMAPMGETFAPIAQSVVYAPPVVDMLSTVDGQWNTAGVADYWCRQLLRPVRFHTAMNELSSRGYRLFLEIGPRPFLTGLGRACLPGEEHTWLYSLNQGRGDCQCLLPSMARMFCRGVNFDAVGFDKGYRRQRVALPNYPFQRSRHWLELKTCPTTTVQSGEGDTVLPLVGRRLALPGSREIRFETRLEPAHSATLQDHRVYGTVVVAAAFHLAMVLEAALHILKSSHLRLSEIRLPRPLTIPEGAGRRLQVLFTPIGDDSYDFTILSCLDETDPNREHAWSSHLFGRLRIIHPASAPPPPPPPPPVPPGTVAVDGAEYYDELGTIGFDLGPSYRWTREVLHGGGTAQCRVAPPKGPWDDREASIHPGLLDTCFQILSRLWPSSSAELLHSGEIYVPWAIAALELHALPRLSSAPLLCQAYREAVPGVTDKVSTAAGLCLATAEGATILTVQGFQFRRTDRSTLLATLRETTDELFDLRWLPSAATLTPAASSPWKWLILADRNGLGAALAAALTGQGHGCRVVEAGQPLNAAIHLPYNGVVYLRTLDQDWQPKAYATATCQALLDTAEEMQTLIKTLSGASPVPRLWLVTRGTQNLDQEKSWSILAQAPLWGLGAVMAAEHPDLKPTCIDLDSTPSTQEAEILASALTSADREDWLAYREGRRYLARLQPRTARGHKHLTIRADSTYLITGGLGGLGLKLATWLVAQGARHLLLNGRHPANEETEGLIARLRQDGARVECYPADIADFDQATELFAHLDARLPPLCGIIHAAGVVDDGLFLHQSRERIGAVLAPKVAGAWHLHRLTQNRVLDFMLFFASAATLVGSRSQAGYAMANTFLDALAQARRGHGLPALSLDWGAWSEAGMAAALPEREQQRWTGRGFAPIAIQRGLDLIGSLLGSDAVQVAILPIDRQVMGASHSVTPFPPRFDELIRTPAALPPPASLPLQLNEAKPEERLTLLEERVRHVLATTLGLQEPERIEPRTRLFDLGFDSILAMEAAERLTKVMGTPLPMTVIFEYPTLAAMVDYLARLAGIIETGTAPAVAAPSDALPLSEADIALLSDDEAEQLLLLQLQNLAE